MSFAAKLASRSGHLEAETKFPRLGTRRLVRIGRDLAVLVGAALTIGVTLGLGMMLVVWALA